MGIATQLQAKRAFTQATSLMRSIINQDYVGDINILPDYRLINPRSLIGFPGEKQVLKLIASANAVPGQSWR